MSGSRPKQDQRFKSKFNIPIARAVDCNWYRTGYRRPTRDGLACTCTHGCPMHFWAANGTPSSQRTCSTKNPIYRICIYDKMCPRVRNPNIHPEPNLCECPITNVTSSLKVTVAGAPSFYIPAPSEPTKVICSAPEGNDNSTIIVELTIKLNCPAPEDIIIRFTGGNVIPPGGCDFYPNDVTPIEGIIKKGETKGTAILNGFANFGAAANPCTYVRQYGISLISNCISDNINISLDEFVAPPPATGTIPSLPTFDGIAVIIGGTPLPPPFP